jgi:hypothetical protein
MTQTEQEVTVVEQVEAQVVPHEAVDKNKIELRILNFL